MKLSLLFISLILLASCTKAPATPADLDAYYSSLRDSCGSDRCCLTSVNMMKNKGALEMEMSCPTGTKEETLLCKNAKKWCEKESILSGATNP